MKKAMKKATMLIASIICIFASGCANMHKTAITPSPLTMISQIDSFKLEVACGQALEVTNIITLITRIFLKKFLRSL